jgi:diguanylate cyclase (GGDEF)-like protein
LSAAGTDTPACASPNVEQDTMNRFADEATASLAFQASPTATIVTDEQLRVLATNAAYDRLCGGHDAAGLGDVPRLYGLHGEPVLDRVRAAGAGRSVACDALLLRADGDRRRVWMSWSPVTGGPQGLGLHVATFCERQGRDDELRRWRHLAHHDALTGLPNREHLEAELERAVARASRHLRRVALLFIDLDGFKGVNDRFGHAAGDRLLVRVGERLRAALRAEDFVARLGGDEFVVLLDDPHEALDAARAAAGLLGALDRGVALPGGCVAAVGASIGIALFPDHGIDAPGLLAAADAAMYRVKRAGGHGVAVGDAQPRQAA